MSFNQSLFRFIFGFAHRSPLLDATGVLIASYLPYALALGAAVFAVFTVRGKRARLLFFLEAALALIVSRGIVVPVIRFFSSAPRPFELMNIAPLFSPSGYASFPSGHAAFFFALAVTLWFVNRRWGWWYAASAAVVGLARVFSGVHWPLDIAGGAIVGVASAWLVHLLFKEAGRAVGAYSAPPPEEPVSPA